MPVPTIHHYRKLGLLPPAAQVVPNRFCYDERHVDALGAIRSLRAHQIPLDTVREVLPTLLAANAGGPTDKAWEALVADGSMAGVDHRGRGTGSARRHAEQRPKPKVSSGRSSLRSLP